ncbi:MAG: type IX secretion system outer membrane channel protein PorV, partial [Bacteroidetes bacterium]|nr:type IX secretion system outer membrane channel protein PorV [Bacteroidota bacterium]
AFVEKKGGLGISYTPWLRNLVPDVSLSYISLYGKIDEFSAGAITMRYFSLGNIQFTDEFGASLGDQKPNEFAIDGAYARKLSDKFSMGVALRFIYSNLVPNLPAIGPSTKAGVSGAGDISAYYKNDTKFSGYKTTYAFGAIIQNMGAKISYTNSQNKDFIPTTLRLGASANVEFDQYNMLMVTAEVNKLLVPTLPYYLKNKRGDDSISADGKKIPMFGKDANVGVVKGMYQSFYDAPGGFKEEMKEYNWSIGAEYWYDKQFAIRTGFFHEPLTKGNRKYFTFGAGLRYNVFGLDFTYLVPLGQQHPLQNTLRFSLIFDLDAFRKQKEY